MTNYYPCSATESQAVSNQVYLLLIGHWVADCAVGDFIRMCALRADYTVLRLSIRRCRRKATCFAPLDSLFPGLRATCQLQPLLPTVSGRIPVMRTKPMLMC
jgi:hypothetical protein